MASQPTAPYYHSNNWDAEKLQIGNQLTPINSTVLTVAEDGLGNIIDHVGCSTYKIRMDHRHVANATDILSSYSFPKDVQEFYKRFRFREWEYVAEAMLVAVRLKMLRPNEFQRFILGLYIHEYHPVCCCECGLTPGFWCGEYFFYSFLIDAYYSLQMNLIMVGEI